MILKYRLCYDEIDFLNYVKFKAYQEVGYDHRVSFITQIQYSVMKARVLWEEETCGEFQ
jgi:hypothetical protein